MASGKNNSVHGFYELFKDSADTRTSEWFLVSSPVPVLLILGAYISFVTYLGPKYMSRRQPVDLSSVLILYNFLQVSISIFLVHEAVDGLLLREDFSFGCQPLIVDRTEEAMREARCIYLYFLAKISELLDTVFFVLRKKTNQVTFLHIYHHSIMPLISWGFARYCPGGHIIFSVVLLLLVKDEKLMAFAAVAFWIPLIRLNLMIGLNSFIHVIMYLYYMLAACGPQIQKYLWWKKYITLMQMIQFLVIAAHNFQLLIKDCNYPKASLLFTFTNAVFFMYLFNNFYGKAYKKTEGLSTSSGKGKLHLK